jgi:Mrp family chromosome partitioning ATPase
MAQDNATYVWIAARARNAVRRRTLLSVITGIAFVCALIGFVLMPHQTTYQPRSGAADTVTRFADTTSVSDALLLARASISQADSALAAARRVIALGQRDTPPPQDTLSPALRAERDSLKAMLASLNEAMKHADESPLPSAFNQLGATPALATSRSVQVWLDSLNVVDKLRAPFGALGAGDPIYVALTARMNELGRSIRDAANERQSELRARLAPLAAPPPPMPTLRTMHVDTSGFVAVRAHATAQYNLARHKLDSLREHNARTDTAATHARDVANVGAPPIAMLGAALVIALAIGFGAVFIGELRNPRVAHMREGEAVSNARVLTVIKPNGIVEQARRQSDVGVPPLIDVGSEDYRTLYLHLAATEAAIPVVTITGDIAAVVATVATNIAAVAAYEARSTLLVDCDSVRDTIAAILRIASKPGLSAMLDGSADVAKALVTTTVGRDRPLDVLPSGRGRIADASEASTSEVRDVLTRMANRYDFLVFAAPASYAQRSSDTVIPVPDVIVCAQVGVTEISTLRAMVRALRGAGKRVHGIVLWDDDRPRP